MVDNDDAPSRLFHSPLNKWDVWLILAALITTGIVLGKDISVGGLRDSDTAVHAMDGVLIHDWIGAGPGAWVEPMQFAEAQYGHYPCLGIGRHYPPAFAIVEAAFFSVFGISPFTARLTVVFFGLLACSGCYVFLRTLTDRPTSLLGSVILMTLPAVTLWGRQTMLEVPILAALAWGAFAFSWYLARPSRRRFTVLLILAALAMTFRQTGVFLLSAIALALFLAAWWRRVPWGHFFVCAALAITAIAGIAFSFGGAAAKMFRGRPSFSSLWGFDALTYYLRQLPHSTGWWILPAAIVGTFLCIRRDRVKGTFLIAWFSAAYLMLCAADLKFDRFFFVGLFPFAVWSALAIGAVIRRIGRSRLRPMAIGLVCTVLCLHAFGQPIQYYPDYGVVVAAHRDKIENRAVLFGGVRDIHFVFAVRQHLPWRSTIAVRSSKLLYTCNTHPAIDFQAIVDSPEALSEMMKRYAFGVVITERNNCMYIPQEEFLRDYLRHGEHYLHVAAHDMRADETPSARNTIVDVYQLAEPRARLVDHIDIPIPRANRTVRINLGADAG